MRVLLVCDPLIPVPPTGYGGIERIVNALVLALRARGHEVGLVAKSGSTCSASVRFFWPCDTVRGPLATVRNAMALRRAAGLFRPDVIHSFARLAYLSPLLPSAVKKVMSYQRHTGGRGVRIAARISGDSLCFTGCSAFIAAMGRAAGGNWKAIPNFVEIEKFTFVDQTPADAPLVFLSRIEPIKGPDLAIKIARAAGRRLILAGNRGNTPADLRYWEQAIAPGIAQGGVEYVGEVDDVAKNAILGRAAALIVPIQWDEPFGIVFAEALACGTPIISCARGALPEIVRLGSTGLFIDSIESGVAAVAQITTLSRSACRQDAERRFSVDVCAGQYETVYREMLPS